MTNQPSAFELYSVYVDTITAAEQRRQNTSSVYYSILIAVSAFLGADFNINILYITVPVTVVSLIFYAKIMYFRSLASAKFKVVKSLESKWEVRPFEIEWLEFKKHKKFKLSGLLTGLEATIPLIVSVSGFIYLVYCFIYFIFENIC